MHRLLIHQWNIQHCVQFLRLCKYWYRYQNSPTQVLCGIIILNVTCYYQLIISTWTICHCTDFVKPTLVLSSHCCFLFQLCIFPSKGVLLMLVPESVKVDTANLQNNVCLMPSLCINTHPTGISHPPSLPLPATLSTLSTLSLFLFYFLFLPPCPLYCLFSHSGSCVPRCLTLSWRASVSSILLESCLGRNRG